MEKYVLSFGNLNDVSFLCLHTSRVFLLQQPREGFGVGKDLQEEHRTKMVLRITAPLSLAFLQKPPNSFSIGDRKVGVASRCYVAALFKNILQCAL